MPHFIEDFWEKNKDLWNGELITRFPPEPNGLLHIGHAKALGVSGGMAKKYGGKMNLRMDDTNPEKEEERYAKGIAEMVHWLGYEWSGEIRHTSDYFDFIFELATDLIRKGLAYVDFTPKEKMREMRGTLTTPGTRSADVDNPIEWHLKAFLGMREGKFADGECVLRAKLDMAHGNVNFRDPVLYRIKRESHPRTGGKWIIYPAYMYAHAIADLSEKVSLSLCSLEFEEQRPLYDWFIARGIEYLKEKDPSYEIVHAPVEMEFARLEMDKGLTSKRKVNALVDAGTVDGWDDPRLVTLAALRRRGFTPSSLRKFCEEAGVSKANSVTPFSRVEDFLRIDLDDSAPRRFVVARPVPLHIIDGGPESPYSVEAPNHPKNESMGTRPFTVSSSWWIDEDDVRSDGKAEAGFKRVEPGAAFRIMHSGLILECVDVEADTSGKILRVVAKPTEKKPRVAIHGLAIEDAVPVEIWEPDVIPSDEADPADYLAIRNGYCESAVLDTDGTWQAVRYGWCARDRNHPERLIRTTCLRTAI